MKVDGASRLLPQISEQVMVVWGSGFSGLERLGHVLPVPITTDTLRLQNRGRRHTIQHVLHWKGKVVCLQQLKISIY